jgi:integrase
VCVEIRVLSPEEVRRFLEAAEFDRFKALWYVLVTTGLRPAEALGLKWEDWDGNKLRVRRALVRVPGQGWSLKETKTRRSRVVALPEMTIRALEEHRHRQKRERLQVVEAYVDRGLIFARSTVDVPPGVVPLPMLDLEPSAVQEVGAF